MPEPILFTPGQAVRRLFQTQPGQPHPGPVLTVDSVHVYTSGVQGSCTWKSADNVLHMETFKAEELEAVPAVAVAEPVPPV
mgnify:FL=1